MDTQHELMARLRELAGQPPGGRPDQPTGSSLEPPEPDTLEAARLRILHLEVALEHRTVISEAVGIVMERFQIDDDRAFAVLVRMSQEVNRKVYDLARELIETGHAESL